ncbi:CDP-glycerol glycerophosphotransferase family protein [Priestia koreensis]|uniref:CDP-glycerol glycerophosphotransferase family protein n=1 Tax=Priestia koreensis TaxID=284581 RepID=UPI003458949C
MNLTQRDQILDLLMTIEEGLDYASKNTRDKAGVMLNDCNNGLFFLQNLLQEHHAIHQCIQEAIHILNSDIPSRKTNELFISDIYRTKESIGTIKEIVVNKLDVELEVLFLPYKASMWDSLESIYTEAQADPNCKCYVVPIPYYEKNEHGEIIKFCYEGNEFPNDVAITPFELYNLEERKPDIVYIHNPYDQYNKLTMVNPNYFSDVLAQYTKMLVYVPYYVAGSIESVAFQLLPSFKNVNKIITQSSALTNTYLISGVDSEKLLTLGSPKIDAMVTLHNRDSELTWYWEKMIENKKVILFNTGIADLLATSMWLERIEEIVSHFLNLKDYVLIWRPHPLTEVTLNTMRPNIKKNFLALKDKINQSSNIIIDKSSNVYTAVNISDALISDYSSIMLQYIVTGKPILSVVDEEMTREGRNYFSDYLGCYFTNEGVTVADFIDILEKDKDYKKENRVNRFKRSITNPDGNSGSIIYNKIKTELINKHFTVSEKG